MGFKKLETPQYPTRQWLLIGHPGSGKSSFSTQMRGPLLPIDADHRYVEVSHFAQEVYALSDAQDAIQRGMDNVDAERIANLLRENMAGSGVKTIIVDSVTSIITPLTVEAILDNDAGRNKNKVAGFKPKALAMRLLQDAVTGWGVDTLWIAHLRDGLDGQARRVESTTISVVELARLRRSLNLQMRVIQEGDKRGIRIDWARRGRSGMTLWDDTGAWKGMPEKIEQAVYGGLTVEQQNAIEKSAPTAFSGPEDAIAWGMEQGCFRDAVHAKNAYDKCKADKKPASASAMWAVWVADVQRRVAETQGGETVPEPDIVEGKAFF